MIGNARKSVAVRWPLAVVAAITIAAVVMLRPSTASAVEYVRIYPIYGAGYFYLPGTDTCIDVATNDARQTTMGGTWDWRSPSNPHTWAPTPADACQDGQLVKFGDVSSSSLTQDSYSRWETNTHYALRLRPGQYIASILYRGGFTGVDSQGNFCMYYYDPVNGIAFPPLGCTDTSPQAGVPATLVFAPDTPVPPSSISQPYLVGANGSDWKAISAADIQGSLSIWLCLQSRQG